MVDEGVLAKVSRNICFLLVFLKEKKIPSSVQFFGNLNVTRCDKDTAQCQKKCHIAIKIQPKSVTYYLNGL